MNNYTFNFFVRKRAFTFARCFATELYEHYLNDSDYDKNPNWIALSKTNGINKLCKLLEQLCPDKDYHILVGNFYHDMKNKILTNFDYASFIEGSPSDTDNRVLWRVYGQCTNFLPYHVTKDRINLYLAHAYFLYTFDVITYQQFDDYRENFVLNLLCFGILPKFIKDMYSKEMAKEVLPMDLLNYVQYG